MKIIERPDGSREIEGTPAELTEYERWRLQPAIIPTVINWPPTRFYGPGDQPAPLQPFTITCQGPMGSAKT